MWHRCVDLRWTLCNLWPLFLDWWVPYVAFMNIGHKDHWFSAICGVGMLISSDVWHYFWISMKICNRARRATSQVSSCCIFIFRVHHLEKWPFFQISWTYLKKHPYFSRNFTRSCVHIAKVKWPHFIWDAQYYVHLTLGSFWFARRVLRAFTKPVVRAI